MSTHPGTKNTFDTFKSYTLWPTDILDTIFMKRDVENRAHWLDEHAKVLEYVLGMDRESGNMIRVMIMYVELSDVLLETIKRHHNEYIRYLHDLDVRREEMKQKVKNVWLPVASPIIFALMTLIFNQVRRQSRGKKATKNFINKLLTHLKNCSEEWLTSFKRSRQRSDMNNDNAQQTKAQPDNRKRSWMDRFKFSSASVPEVPVLDDNDEGPICCVCMDSPPQVVLVPCGHMNICDPCAREWKKKRNVGEGKKCGGSCPTCRRKIKKIKPIILL